MRLAQEKETYDKLTKALQSMSDSIDRWDVQMINYSYTDDEGAERWLRIMVFQLNMNEINPAITKTRPESRILRDLRETIIDLKQEWWAVDWPVLTEAQRAQNTLAFFWPSWDKVEEMIRKEIAYD